MISGILLAVLTMAFNGKNDGIDAVRLDGAKERSNRVRSTDDGEKSTIQAGELFPIVLKMAEAQ